MKNTHTSIFDLIKRHKESNKLAFIQRGRTISYRQLYSESILLTRKIDLTCKTVGILMDNSIDLITTFWGIIYSKSIAVFITPALKFEINLLIELSNIDLIITEDKYVEKLLELEIQIPIFVLDKNTYLNNLRKNMFNKSFDSEDIVAIMPTSGTTNKEKLICLTNKCLTKNLRILNKLNGRNENTTELVVGNIGTRLVFEGQILVNMLNGGCIVFYNIPFLKNHFLQYLHEYNITHCYFVPTLLRLLLSWKIEEKEMNKLTEIDIIGEKLNSKTVIEFFNLYPNITLYYGYGMTETGVISFSQCKKTQGDKISEGKIINGVTIKINNIINPHDPKNIGEIEVLNDNGICYSLGNKNIDKTCFFKTGDIGYIDKQSNVHIIGRQKGMINLNGTKIFPEEVEAVIRQHKSVQDVIVYCENNKLCADIVLLDDINVDEIKKYCITHLAPFKVPYKFAKHEKLEKTLSNKLSRIR